ncbi:1133_t:CDS:2 [Funneliformis geosporum]|nr:1133_t:CDS:2 [Funneliformis geosporum]
MSNEDDEVKREPYTKKIILFASNYVGKQVTKKLKTSILNKLLIELEESLSNGKSNQFLASDDEIPFYFVMPSQLYDIYKKQNFAIINNAIAKNVPPWIINQINSGGLRRMTSTALIEEQLSNLSTFEEPSTATTTEDVEISTSLSIPAKRPLLDRNFLDRTCKKKREGHQ